MTKENFYLILGLDPSEQEGAKVEKKIEEQRRKWSHNKTNGSKNQQDEAAKYMLLIPAMKEMALKPEEMLRVAQEAKTILQQRESDLRKKLEGLLADRLPEKFGATELNLLAKSLGGDLNQDQVKQLLRDLGISLDEKATIAPPSRPLLDTIQADRIRKFLQTAGKVDLYDFLKLRQNASPESLHARASEILKEIQRRALGPRDLKESARKGLAGYATVIFRSKEEKTKYDNSLAVEAMNSLVGDLEWVSESKALTEEHLDKVVLKGRALGVDEALAEEFIRNLASARKWIIIPRRLPPPPRLPTCGFCGQVANEPNTRCCRKCGREFILSCPKCKEPTPTENACCVKCGCATGDRPLVEHLMKEGGDFLQANDFDQAEACFNRALSRWPDYPPAKNRRQEAQTLRATQKAAFEAIDNLIMGARFEAAHTALQKLGIQVGVGRGNDLRDRIARGLDQAQAALLAGDAHRAAGRLENAVDHYLKACQHCIDFSPAQRALAALPPLAPTSLIVSVGGVATQLRWNRCESQVAVTYRVQRKTLSPPAGPGDGTTLAEGPGRDCPDPAMPTGVPVYYAVFTLRGGVLSQGAALSGPHLRAADPTDVRIEAGKGELNLRWTPPPGATTVEVWRGDGITPPLRGQGTLLPSARSSIADTGLMNGKSYDYLVLACYTDPLRAGQALCSPGVRITGTPLVPPPAVIDLQARREGRMVLLTWTPPALGETQIRQAHQRPGLSPGLILTLSEADRLGTLVPIRGAAMTQATLEGRGTRYFTVLSVQAQTVVVGSFVAVSTLDEVKNLVSNRQGRTIRLTWNWPSDATQALVSWRSDAHPASPEDRAEGKRIITLAEYERNGLCEIPNAPLLRHYFMVFVSQSQDMGYSAGVPILEAGGLETEVSYRIVQRRGLFGHTVKKAWVELKCKGDLTGLPPLRAVVKHGAVPLSPDDGNLLASHVGIPLRNGRGRLDLDLAGGTGFVKLFFEDSTHAREIRLIPADSDHILIG